jgi:hypothetical protein
LLAALDDAATRSAVAAERQLLAARGGGCHQRFGATQVAVPGLGALLHVREAGDDGVMHSQLQWQSESPLAARGAVRAVWDGSLQSPLASESLPEASRRTAAALAAAPAAFIAHRRALPDDASSVEALTRCAHVWVPGTETWLALAQRGVWVEGSAEGLGFETLLSTLTESVLQLPPLPQWLVLTNDEAVAGWTRESGPRVLATYRHALGDATADAAAGKPNGGSPLAASHIYWHSAAQFQHWANGAARFAPDAQHACGFGKTAERLRAAGIVNLSVFPSAREWRAWLQS